MYTNSKARTYKICSENKESRRPNKIVYSVREKHICNIQQLEKQKTEREKVQKKNNITKTSILNSKIF